MGVPGFNHPPRSSASREFLSIHHQQPLTEYGASNFWEVTFREVQDSPDDSMLIH